MVLRLGVGVHKTRMRWRFFSLISFTLSKSMPSGS